MSEPKGRSSSQSNGRGPSQSNERGPARTDQRLRVNPIKCTGHGMCAELLPEFITLDPWGYPIISPDPVPEEFEGLARRAVADCPTLALLIGNHT